LEKKGGWRKIQKGLSRNGQKATMLKGTGEGLSVVDRGGAEGGKPSESKAHVGFGL